MATVTVLPRAAPARFRQTQDTLATLGPGSCLGSSTTVNTRFSLDAGILAHAVGRDAGERHARPRDIDSGLDLARSFTFAMKHSVPHDVGCKRGQECLESPAVVACPIDESSLGSLTNSPKRDDAASQARARRYRDRAHEIRLIAEDMRDAECHATLMRLANSYDEMAARVESPERQR